MEKKKADPEHRSQPILNLDSEPAKLSDLLHGNSLHASIQTALVAAGGVLGQNALLDALVEHRDSGAISCAKSLRVALRNRLTQRTQCAAQLALVSAVHRGFGLGLTCALQ
jgi:hypothetical protein